MKKNKIINVSVQGGNNGGGYEYNLLEAPCVELYVVDDVTTFKIGNDTFWHGYFLGKDLSNKKLLLDANPRKPEKTRVVSVMTVTIKDYPKKFHLLNNGMTIIARDVKYNKESKQLSLSFGEKKGNYGDGICNGGHTYFAIEQFNGKIDKDVRVAFTIIEIDPKLEERDRLARIKEISEARNSHNELKSSTTNHFLGYYDNFRKYLSASPNKSIYVKWFEGDPNAIKKAEGVEKFIAQLTSISPFWFQHYLGKPDGGIHMKAARNTKNTHETWANYVRNDPDSMENLYNIIPLIPDVLLLKDFISKSLESDSFKSITKVWKNTALWKYLKTETIDLNHLKDEKGNSLKGYNISHPFMTMILGAFRENVWYSINDDGVNLVGWLIDPFPLWDEQKENLMKKLNFTAVTINAPSFGNAFLQNSSIYVHQLTQQKFGDDIFNQANQPEIIFDTDTKTKYRLCKEAHELESKIDDLFHLEMEVFSKDDNLISAHLVKGFGDVNYIEYEY